MVATSAFGVGIDKADVRTVIRATVPETVDRFYQEVGRGGRDGRACSSLLLFSEQDRKVAETLGAHNLISDELGFERWSALTASAKALDPLGFLLEVDLDVVPPRLSQQSDYNVAWNMRTLIMMAHAGLLDLESEPPVDPERLMDETDVQFEERSEAYWTSYFRKTVVRLRYEDYRSEAVFNERMGLERSRTFNAALTNGALLDRLLLGTTEVSGTPGRPLSEPCAPALRGGLPRVRRVVPSTADPARQALPTPNPWPLGSTRPSLRTSARSRLGSHI